MHRWRVLLVAVMASLLLLAFAGTAFATVTVIASPDAAYLGGTTKIDISGIADFASVTSVSDGSLTAVFDAAVSKYTVGAGWATWSSPPQSEASNPAVLYAPRATASISLSRLVTTFGLEMEGNQWIDSSFTVVFKISSGGQVISTQVKTINGSSGAKLVAIKSDVPFDKVEITTSDVSGFAVGQLRYSTALHADIGNKFGDKVVDTYMYSAKPAANLMGTSSSVLCAGKTAEGEEKALLSFPLAKFLNGVATDATLSLTKATGSTGYALRAYRVRQAFDNSACWNVYSTGSAWGLAGGCDAATDYVDTVYAESTNGTFDVTSLVNAAIAAGDDSLDIIVVDPAPVTRRYTGFYSSEAIHAPYRPALTIEGNTP